MKSKRIYQLILIFTWMFVIEGCVTTSTQRTESLISSLPKLTSAVEGLVRYSDDDNKVPDNNLLAEIYRIKPEIQRTFKGYLIKIRHDSKYVVIMVCSKDNKYALLEDASWTQGIDHEWFRMKPLKPAVFTMDPAQKEKDKP